MFKEIIFNWFIGIVVSGFIEYKARQEKRNVN